MAFVAILFLCFAISSSSKAIKTPTFPRLQRHTKVLAKVYVKTLRNVNVNRNNTDAGRYMVITVYLRRFTSLAISDLGSGT